MQQFQNCILKRITKNSSLEKKKIYVMWILPKVDEFVNSIMITLYDSLIYLTNEEVKDLTLPPTLRRWQNVDLRKI